jgi:hypothetical protein
MKKILLFLVFRAVCIEFRRSKYNVLAAAVTSKNAKQVDNLWYCDDSV